MRYAREQIVTAASMASNVVSLIIPIDQCFGYAIQANYTTSGNLGGTFTVQASLDHQQDLNGNVIVAGTFNTVANTSTTITGAGSTLWDIPTSNALYIKLVYTKFSGDTGTLNAFSVTKGN